MSNMLGIIQLLGRLPETTWGVVFDLLTKLIGEEGEKWFRELTKFLRKETCWVIGRLSNPHLRQIVTGLLRATTGQRTLAKMKNLFTGGLDSDFTNWGTNVAGPATTEAPFEVYEMIKNGTFAQIFGGFGVDLKKLCWSQDQIITFVEDHSDLLHPQEWATFFLFSVKFDEGTENEREEFFVADVDRAGDGRLEAVVGHLSDDGVWDAVCRYRFVLPQLAA